MAELLYEGKAKKVFATADPNEVVIYYKDDATALNGAKHGTIVDKGIMNNTITTFFFDLLAKNGIPHHIIKKLSDREQLCKKVKIIPVEVVCRNIAAGSLAKWAWKKAMCCTARWLSFTIKATSWTTR